MNTIVKKAILLFLLVTVLYAQENATEIIEETTEFFLTEENLKNQLVEASPDFRGVFWNSSKKTVLAKELSQALQEKSDRLVYQTDYLGFPVKLYYLFWQDKLVNGQIVFPSTFSYAQKRKDIFLKVKKHLEQKWGSPLVDETSALKKDSSSLDKSFRFKTVWATNNNFISLNFWSKQEKHYLKIVFVPNQNRKTETKEDFIAEPKNSEVMQELETQTDIPNSFEKLPSPTIDK